jgi:hypothetical protein
VLPCHGTCALARGCRIDFEHLALVTDLTARGSCSVQAGCPCESSVFPSTSQGSPTAGAILTAEVGGGAVVRADFLRPSRHDHRLGAPPLPRVANRERSECLGDDASEAPNGDARR